MFLFISVAATSLFCYFLYECFFGRPLRFIRHFEAQGIYGPPFRPIVGALPEIQAAAAKYEIERHGIATAQQYGYVHTLMVGFMPLLAIADPEILRELFTSQAHCYHKSEDSQKDFLRPLQGNGLLLSEDEYWKKQRALVSPAFHFSCLKEMVPMMVDSAAVVMKKWAASLDQRIQAQQKDRDYVEIGMNKELAGFTLDTVATAAFGSAFHDNPEMQQAFIHTLKDVLDAIQFRVLTFIAMIPIVRMLPCLGRSTIVNGCRRIDEIVHRVVEDRRSGRSSSVGARKDLLDMLLEARDENGTPMPIAAVEEESKNFISAGAETTSNLLTWMVYRMALDSRLWSQCAAEVRRVLGGAEPDAESVKELKLIEAVAYEALRLHPPAPLLPKFSIKEHTLHAPDGRTLHIPAGVNITINTNVVHRNPLYWEEPESFRPQRFLSGADSRLYSSTSTSSSSSHTSSSLLAPSSANSSSDHSNVSSTSPSSNNTSSNSNNNTGNNPNSSQSSSTSTSHNYNNNNNNQNPDGDIDSDLVLVDKPTTPSPSLSDRSLSATPVSANSSSTSASPSNSSSGSSSTSSAVNSSPAPLSALAAAALTVEGNGGPGAGSAAVDDLIDFDDTADSEEKSGVGKHQRQQQVQQQQHAKKQHPFAFLGFSAGPRKCIGKNFAMLEIKVIIAMILQRFTFEVAPGQTIVPDPITRIPKYDIVMKVRNVVPPFDPSLPPQSDDSMEGYNNATVLKPTGMI